MLSHIFYFGQAYKRRMRRAFRSTPYTYSVLWHWGYDTLVIEPPLHTLLSPPSLFQDCLQSLRPSLLHILLSSLRLQDSSSRPLVSPSLSLQYLVRFCLSRNNIVAQAVCLPPPLYLSVSNRTSSRMSRYINTRMCSFSLSSLSFSPP